MLKTRLATAGILISIVIGGVAFFPPCATAVVFAGFLVVASWEWTRLAGWRSKFAICGYMCLIGASAILIYHYVDMPIVIEGLTGAACVWWCIAFAWLIGYEKGGPSLPDIGFGIGFIGCFVLATAWAAVVALLKHNAVLLLALFVLIWSADSMAYFAGRRWGKHRLAPRISPGKTWEGLCAALAASVPIAAVIASSLGFSGGSTAVFCSVALVSVTASVVGDLVVSVYKRHQGMKDSGSILPGHGGILDRIDSLLAAAPVFVFSLRLVHQ